LLKIISLFLFAVFSFADIVKIYATSAKEVNKTIILNNPYLIYNDEFFIQSKKAIIKNKHTAIFSGDVIIFYKNGTLKSDKVKIVTSKNITLGYSFYYDKELGIWFKAKDAILKNKNILIFKNAIFSSCCVKKPDWYLFVKKGSFNKKNKYLKLYNITLYIHRTPVFYFPFFFNSLNKKRKSGLLRPYIGFSTKEGFLYSQPIYFVTSIRSDLEITPTIRTFRGRGVYSQFRFVDSPYSFGIIKGGVFIDYDKYYEKYNLAHKKHFGYEFNYKRDKVFGGDKLYVDLKYANDVDYFYLNPTNYRFNTAYLTDKIITSKINYVKNFLTSVFGIYNRYFIDTSVLNNENTLQVLPQLNYHVFENKRLLITSFDYNFYNYYSQGSKRYFINSFNLPIALNFSLFNNYLNLKISEIFKGEHGNFYNSSTAPSYSIDAYTQFKFLSSFTKYNNNFLHVVSPEITFNVKNFSKIKKRADIINLTSIQNSVSFNLYQILKTKNLYLEHTFHQFYNIENKTSEPMENQINFSIDRLNISDTNKFDWNLKKPIYNAFSLQYTFLNNDTFSISHIYQYSPIIKSIDLKFNKQINKYKKLYFEYNYDIINKYPKFWLAGVSLNKKCWQYDFSFKKALTPVLKESGISYNVDYILSFYVNFYPIGGLKQSILFR